MSSVVKVAIHASQFPDRVRRELIESLRTRRINHKFHYDSLKQTRKWLALHEAYSPARTDPDCGATYDRSFDAVAARIHSERVHLIGLGCGGGQKDTRLLAALQTRGRQTFYSPIDVSAAMVLVAHEVACAVIPPARCFPLVCDLAVADDLARVLEGEPIDQATRLITFFGMIPNFEPEVILPRLASLVKPGDYLLFSANLAPGPDYAAGVRRLMPLYDNALTRDWLMTLLWDLGVEASDGEMRLVVEPGPESPGLMRIAAYFDFTRPRTIQVGTEAVEFLPGEVIRLFFSYRYTPALVQTHLAAHGLAVQDQWITKTEEEGVFLVSRRGD